MYRAMVGSELTRSMLKRGHQDIWCAVSDESDENAMEDQMSNDFTARIVSFREGQFYCAGDMPWLCAVPIKIIALRQSEVSF
ncbi:hypothetical protein [Psychrobacter immobilis]|uniref:hypothetical protein n=1 Tax=Psychrobacter immobilis TaxID=498 RepID=UPI00191A9879|nr:hypothetical protein [Psychrobacter immobilis]